MTSRPQTILFLILALLLFPLPLRAQTPSPLYTPSQLDAAATSATTPIRWAESSIYGGLDSQHYPLRPIPFSSLSAYASIPLQPILTAPATPIAEPSPLRLHLPAAIRHRFLYTYDSDLSNVIYVEHRAPRWNNRFFDFHFFEELFIHFNPSFTFRNGRRLNDNLFLWSRPAGWQPGVHRDEYLFYMIQSDSIFFECAGRVWTSANSLYWEATIVNHSTHNWVDPEYQAPGALMCFRTRNNPDFRDRLGVRTYYHDPTDTRLRQSVFDLDGNTISYYHQWTYLPDAPYANILTKFNQAGDLWVVARSDPPRSVGGNRADGISCIHPNVGFATPRGAAQTVTARVDFAQISSTNDWPLYR